MSHIPDTRTDEYYNEDYLNKEDTLRIDGYDWCAEEVVDNFFNNLDVDFGEETYFGHVLAEELPESMKESYMMYFAFGDKESEERQITTYADLLRYKLIEWIEMGRNELITSMLDNMSEEEYDRRKAEVDAKETKEDK